MQELRRRKQVPSAKKKYFVFPLFLLRSVGIVELLSLDSVCKIHLEALLATQEQKSWFVKVHLTQVLGFPDGRELIFVWVHVVFCAGDFPLSAPPEAKEEDFRGFLNDQRGRDISSLWDCPDALCTHWQPLHTVGCRYKFSLVLLFGQTQNIRGKTPALSLGNKRVPQGIPGVIGKNEISPGAGKFGLAAAYPWLNRPKERFSYSHLGGGIFLGLDDLSLAALGPGMTPQLPEGN